MHKKFACLVAVVAVAGSICITAPQVAFGQNVPTVSMVTLQTLPGQNGQQMVVTPKGKVVPLPGAGVNSNVVQIFIGSQGGYWYVDKNGQQVDLTSAVQYMQHATQAQQVPQYAPQPVTVNNYEQQSSSSGSGSSAAGTAVAAGLGAATGAALTNALMEPNYGYYHGVPYGMPMYYGANNHPYYVDRGGNNVYVNNQNELNRTANVNATQNNVNAANVHANALAEQQKWYNQQAANKTNTFQNWQKQPQENPFVHPDAQQGWQNARQAGGDNQGGGRFGRRNRGGGDAAGGGVFGNRDGGAGGGGIFGNRDGGAGGGGILNGGGAGAREGLGGGALGGGRFGRRGR